MTTYFDIYRPETDPLPIVVDVPHAGEWIPPEMKEEMAVGDRTLRRDLDLYVDEIWKDAPQLGATLIVSNVSRYVIDLNRSDRDISEHTVLGGKRVHQPGFYQDRGVVWRTTTDGTPVMAGPLTKAQFDRRIETFHTPYHGAIAGEIARIKEMFGYCILVDGHSMPSLGRKGADNRREVRADIVPGDVDGTSCSPAVLNAVIEHFADRGFSVEPNAPYAGGWITRSFAAPQERVHAIQIEINRDLYMNEKTFIRKRDGMSRLLESCNALLPRLATLDL